MIWNSTVQWKYNANHKCKPCYVCSGHIRKIKTGEVNIFNPQITSLTWNQYLNMQISFFHSFVPQRLIFGVYFTAHLNWG